MKKYLFLISFLLAAPVAMSMDRESSQQEHRYIIRCPTCRRNHTTTNQALLVKTNENIHQRMCTACRNRLNNLKNRMWSAQVDREESA